MSTPTNPGTTNPAPTNPGTTNPGPDYPAPDKVDPRENPTRRADQPPPIPQPETYPTVNPPAERREHVPEEGDPDADEGKKAPRLDQTELS